MGLSSLPLLTACASVVPVPRPAFTPTPLTATATVAPSPPPEKALTSTPAPAATSTPSPSTSPAKAPTTAEVLSGFDAVVQHLMSLWAVPGLAVGIVRQGEVIYRQGFGTRNGQPSAAVTPQTLFAIGSCSKAFTTLGLGILADEQRLDWDKPIISYLPSFKLADAFATERMTARDLATHRSGLPRHDLVWYSSNASRQELVSRLQYLQPSADFRYRWQYQNMMYMTAGALIEKVSGMSWEDFTSSRILGPLGMHATTYFDAQSSQRSDFALPNSIVASAPNQVVKPLPILLSPAIAPAGGIVSNIDDMCRWLRLQLGNGSLDGTHIVSEQQLATMHRPQMVMPYDATYAEIAPVTSYGLGWEVGVYRGHVVVSHEGEIDGFNGQVTLLPELNSGIVALSNLEVGVLSLLALNALDRLLGLDQIPWLDRGWAAYAPIKAEAAAAFQRDSAGNPTAAIPRPLASYTGAYTNQGYGTLTITLQAGQLQAQLNALTFPIVHAEADAFKLIWEDNG
ncbi:MAG TPA: serine hydrolase, partial [Chloroflexota bacterium]|nr:serine hydrolase [Chloroflexota bacterium]